MKIKDLVLAFASALALTAAAMPQGEDPQDGNPVSIPRSCKGCVASVTLNLPVAFSETSVIDGCDDGTIVWTYTRNYRRSGRCVDVQGSCLIKQQCLAFGHAIGTATHGFGNTTSIDLQAGAYSCGDSDEAEMSFGDDDCFGEAEAIVKASCSACRWE